MSIDVGAVTGTQSSLYTNSTSSTAAKQSLDSESFMTLLVAQLKYQDPSSPMSTNEMMTQTTQLASMEQLTKLSTTMSDAQFCCRTRRPRSQLHDH
jgi:flagellar basal-body rod modification protein FlgD